VSVILALDQGTTTSRALVFDQDGLVRGVAQREFAQYFPRPGWVEHDPHDLWQSQYETARMALRAAGMTAADVAAIGIANQRETTLLWDRRTGAPLSNAIVWQDRRTAEMCDELRARIPSNRITALTGLVLDPYFSATKLSWLLNHVHDARERAARGELAFGTVDTWLIWNLTGGAKHVTDVTNASRTMLFDIRKLSWSEELLAAFDIPPNVLPQVLACTHDFGATTKELFGRSIRICGVAGDQQAALIGQAGFKRGIAKNTYGTGSFVMLNSGRTLVRSTRGLLTTIAFSFDNRDVCYALEGSVFISGAAIQWLRDGLRIIDRTEEIEQLAREVRDNGDVYFVPAFTGLGAPYWDPHARGIIVGITRGTTRAHIARAALEAVAFQCADVIAAMEQDSAMQLTELRVDGGGSVNELTMQLQSDLLAVPVVRPAVTETTALGAAYLAGLQSGYWADVDAVERHWRQGARFIPTMAQERRLSLLRTWHRAVERTRRWSE
jgi:glycerol kinase